MNVAELNFLSAPAPRGETAKLRDLLASDQVKYLTDGPVQVKVSDTIFLWQSRLGNTGATKKVIHGAAQLIERLSTLAPDDLLERQAFTGQTIAGTVYSDAKRHKYIGAVIVDR
jgi:hypothetical protein